MPSMIYPLAYRIKPIDEVFTKLEGKLKRSSKPASAALPPYGHR